MIIDFTVTHLHYATTIIHLRSISTIWSKTLITFIKFIIHLILFKLCLNLRLRLIFIINFVITYKFTEFIKFITFIFIYILTIIH